MALKVDLYQEVYDLVTQIPDGKVTTYGTIAKALGDSIAARAVGRILNLNPDPASVPCYRVVRAEGKLGGYKGGKKQKRDLLEADGLEVRTDQIVDFEDYLFSDFHTDVPLERLKEHQRLLADQVILNDSFETLERIGGVDASYRDRHAYGSCVVLNRAMDVLEVATSMTKVTFPYVPTFFSYHELPVVKEAVQKVETRIDLLFVDGNGLIHPRLGFASHLGIAVDLPTIGVAKNLLCGTLPRKPEEVGETQPVRLNDEVVGYAAKTYKTATPIYISPGHRISLDSARRITFDFCEYKLPEPIRKAHKESKRLRSHSM